MFICVMRERQSERERETETVREREIFEGEKEGGNKT